jgi:hypothetical protein
MIDTGAVGRWVRTASGFNTGGTNSVCRFYGNGAINPATGRIFGPNSHFYTADPAECASLKSLFDPNAKSWKFESNDFMTSLPAAGKCAAGQVEVYRAYNNGFARGIDSNHRITSNPAAYQQTVAGGWSGEGVVMCAPGQVLTGVAFFGAISGATIIASSVVNGTKGPTLGTTGTDPKGNFSVNIGNYIGPVMIEANGGTYTDQVTGATVNLDSPLRAAIANSFGATSVAITPITEAVVQNAETSLGALTVGNILGANQQVQQQFGFDPKATIPTVATDPLSSTVNDAAKAYSAYVAGVSQYIRENANTSVKLAGKAKTVHSAAADYAAAIKAGGIATSAAITSAQNNFLTGDKNKTGIGNIIALQTLSSTLAAASLPFPTFGPDVTITGTGTIPSGFSLAGYAAPVNDATHAHQFVSLWLAANVGQTVTITRPADYTSACQGTGGTQTEEKFAAFSGACQGSGNCSFQIAQGGNYQVREDWTYRQLPCAPDFSGLWQDRGPAQSTGCGVIVQPAQLLIQRIGSDLFSMTGSQHIPGGQTGNTLCADATVSYSGTITAAGAYSETVSATITLPGYPTVSNTCASTGTIELINDGNTLQWTVLTNCDGSSGTVGYTDRVQ